MKERPILFSAPMVRALLDGSKPQTRRIVKPKIGETLNWFGGKDGADDDRTLDELLGQRIEEGGVRVWCVDYPEEGSELVPFTYGQPGDRLWVREAWARTTVGTGTKMVVYRESDNRTDYGGPWKPGIHMFRSDSRITLEITGVRVERLQDISRGDAMAEGCPFTNMAQGEDPRRWYAELWESIQGPGSWAANPWVWVVEFKKVTS